jgi:hypothetical protein
MTRLTEKQEEDLRSRFESNLSRARSGGNPSSEYFLDKCGAEAGDTYEVLANEPESVPTRSPLAVLLGDSWLGRLLRH